MLGLHSLCPGQTASLQGVKNSQQRVHNPAHHPVPICCRNQGSFSPTQWRYRPATGRHLGFTIKKAPSESSAGAPFDRSNGIYSLTSLPGTKSRKDPSDTASCSVEHPLTWGLQERGFGPRELRCERCSVSHELGNHDLAEHRESIWAPEYQQNRDTRHSLGQSMGVKR